MEQRTAGIRLEVNGEEREFRGPADTPLLWVLRDAFGLKGTKYGCGTGACGSCVVLMQGEPRHACTLPVADAAGKRVVTIEGLALGRTLHPLQEAFNTFGASQCGYCTPGMIMTSYHLLEQNPNPSEEEIRHGLEGNYCRCTGYQNIVAAVQTAAEKMRA